MAEPGWTPAIACILVYLFVVHSYRLPLGSTAIVVGLVALAFEMRLPRIPTFLLWWGIYLLWALGTMSMGIAPHVSWNRWLDFGKLWLIAFLVANAAQSEKQWRIILVGWLSMFALFPFRGTAMNFLAGISHFGRYAWNYTFANPNDLAAISLLILSLCMAFVRTPDRRWIRWSARAGATCIPLLIVVTGSRGGLLAMGVFFAVLLAFSKRKAGTSLLVVVAFVVAFPLMPDNITQRFINMRFLQDTETLGQADSSAEQRYRILQVAYAVASDHPIFGVGLGNYPRVNELYAASRGEWKIAAGRRDAHNTYLTIASETGVPGLLIMTVAAVSLLGSLFASLSQGRKLAETTTDCDLRDALLNRPPAFIAGTCAFLIACLFGSYVYLIFPFLFAVAAQGVMRSTLDQATVAGQPSIHQRGPAFSHVTVARRENRPPQTPEPRPPWR